MRMFILLFFGLMLSSRAASSTNLDLPYIDGQSFVLGRDKFDVGIYSINHESGSRFVFAAYRNGVMIDVRLLDGIYPTIVKQHDRVWSTDIVGIRFKDGGHQTTIKYFAVDARAVHEIGSISSSAACIYRLGVGDDRIGVIDEDRGEITLTTYRIRRNGVLEINSAKGWPFKENSARGDCDTRSLE